MTKKPITNKVIDIKTKKSKNLITQNPEDQVNWVINELCKVVDRAHKRKIDGYDVSIALAEYTVDFVHRCAPDTLAAQHLLTTAMQATLEDILQKRLRDKND